MSVTFMQQESGIRGLCNAYSRKKGVNIFFKKKIKVKKGVTFVTKSKSIVKSILLGHFLLLQICYMVLQNQIIVVYQRFLVLQTQLEGGKMIFLKKYTYPIFSFIEETQ